MQDDPYRGAVIAWFSVANLACKRDFDEKVCIFPPQTLLKDLPMKGNIMVKQLSCAIALFIGFGFGTSLSAQTKNPKVEKRLRRVLSLVVVLLTLFAVPAFAEDITLNFDDINTYYGQSGLPRPYGGLTFSDGWMAMQQWYYNGPWGNDATFPSQPNAVCNWNAGAVSITGPAFEYISASFAGWGEKNEVAYFTPTSVKVEGFLGSEYVGTEIVPVLPAGSEGHFTTPEPANWVVDTLVFTPQISGQDVDSAVFLMDDFRYSTDWAVPEPSSGVLVLSGVVLLALADALKRRCA